MQIPEGLEGQQLEEHKDKLVNYAVGQIEALVERSNTSGKINFNKSDIAPYYQDNASDFACAIQYTLLKNGRSFEGERMYDALTGELSQLSTLKCPRMSEVQMTTLGVSMMNDYLDKHPDVLPDKGYFEINDYFTDFNISSR